MYPLKFKPNFKTFVWGGEKIAPYKGVETDMHHIGESWEISSVAGRESVVANGPLAGRTLPDVVREYKERLLGRKVYETTGEEFPLLVKFIDALNDLSIQVHPDDALAAARHDGSKGKTEMWYIMKADEGAGLYSGLKEEISPEDYVTLVDENRITEVLSHYEVREGDVFFLPAGRIHALGKGTFVAEIQQTSDITYRIYDYGRLGLDGKPRELHTELAKDAIDYSVRDDYQTHYEVVKDAETPLVDCKYFTTSIFELSGEKEVSVDTASMDSFYIVICLEGHGEIFDGERDDDCSPTKGHVIPVRQGETVLIPATSVSLRFRPEGKMKLMTSHIR